MQDLLALHGEQSGEDALGQASAEHDDLHTAMSESCPVAMTRLVHRILHPWSFKL